MAENSAGGSEFVAPRALNVQQFAAARASEAEALYSLLKDQVGPGNLSTARHLRRRTNSHNRRKSFFWTRKQKKKTEAAARDGAGADQVQDDRGAQEARKVAKPPCRKIRRRIQLRRLARGEGGTTQDGTQRLVTHVWHAKRFKMKKMWGYLLAEGLNGRGMGSRAVIRWAKNSAVLHDASYYSPIQLEGLAGDILEVLSSVLHPSPLKPDALSECVETENFGASYGNAVLHHAGSFPFQTIAPVTYMWRPMQTVADEPGEEGTVLMMEKKRLNPGRLRHLWIWIHAAAVEEALESLQAACKSQGGIVCCRSRLGDFGRLDVMGTRAIEVLRKVLRPYSRCADPLRTCEEISAEPSDLQAQETCDTIVKPMKSTGAVYPNLLSFAEKFPVRSVVAMDVCDPRDPSSNFTWHTASHSATVEASSADISLSVHPQETDEAAAYSATTDEKDLSNVKILWWELLRNTALWKETSDCPGPLTEQVLSSERHKHRLSVSNASKTLPPGQDASHSGRRHVCPLLLLKHEQHNLSSSRWSLIMPISWVQGFWVPLVFAGGHVVGMRELRWLNTDAGQALFPFDYPDCGAYTAFVKEKSSFLIDYNNKRPSVNHVVPLLSPWHLGEVVSQRIENIDSTAREVEVKQCEKNIMLVTSSKQPDETDSGLPLARAVQAEPEPNPLCQRGGDGNKSAVGRSQVESTSFSGNGDAVSTWLGNAVTMVDNSQQVDGSSFRVCNPNRSSPVADVAGFPTALEECGTTSFFVARAQWLIAQVLSAQNLSYAPFCSKEMGTSRASPSIPGSRGLVRVNVQAPRKGSIEDGAIIFVPSSSDVDAWFRTSDRWQGYQVMDHVCHNKQGSKRKSRQMEADGKRKVRRKMQEPTSGTSTDGGLQSLTTGIAARAVTASQQTSMSAEQRERIGFVTSPGVRGSFPETAVAFCELVKLGQWRAAQMADRRWKDSAEIFLLVRNPFSTVYRPAIATISFDSA